MPEYTVRQGDTTTRIAYEHGFFVETIWNHPNNEELRKSRDNPNILHPGDVILIPDRQKKEESCATEQKHHFRRRGVPERLRLRLLDENDEPRTDVSYTLEIDGRLFIGITNSEGVIEQHIPPNATSGRLLVGEFQEEDHELELGYLDPIDYISGVQERLKNLYIFSGEINGEMNDETRLAIREFQRRHGLDETGEMNDETRSRLQELHGS